ncbi:MAG TPA: hypothetical protein VF227_08615, partial [Actinomycetes bacterium]
VMGALIVARYPRHPIGWLLSAGGTFTAFSLACESYGLWVIDHGGPGSEYVGRAMGWLAVLTQAPLTLVTLTAIFLLAPDGHLPSRRWRAVLWAAVGGLGLYVAGVFTVNPQDIELNTEQDISVLTEVLTFAGILVISGALVASVVSLVRRLSRSVGVERQQLRWIASSAIALAIGLAFALFAPIVGGEDNYSLSLPLFLAYFAFPICTAVAVLRYRLFDLDLIINRALMLTLATGLVAVGYVLVVIVIGAAVGQGTGGFWPSLLATAVVAMAFQPARRWVVRLADRLAYGAAATPYEALADFSRRLGESPDPSRLLPAVADAAGTAVNARRATVRLPVPGAPDHVGTWPAGEPTGPGGPSVEVPVVERDETLGTITVEMPPGRALRAHDTRLLRDLADQAAIAFRNARLSAELAHQVEALDRRTFDLIESRRRLITAGDLERSRLERSIAREVVPHLEPLPARLEELAGAANGTLDVSRLQPLVAASQAALEALREITRGVFPAQLSRAGLEPALGSLLARTGSGRLVVAGAHGRRLDDRVEAAAYFCVAEAVRELSPPVEVVVDDAGAELRLAIRGRDSGHLSIAHMRDRVETVGGTVTGRTADGSTVLDVCLPVRSPEAATA